MRNKIVTIFYGNDRYFSIHKFWIIKVQYRSKHESIVSQLLFSIFTVSLLIQDTWLNFLMLLSQLLRLQLEHIKFE